MTTSNLTEVGRTLWRPLASEENLEVSLAGYVLPQPDGTWAGKLILETRLLVPEIEMLRELLPGQELVVCQAVEEYRVTVKSDGVTTDYSGPRAKVVEMLRATLRYMEGKV